MANCGVLKEQPYKQITHAPVRTPTPEPEGNCSVAARARTLFISFSLYGKGPRHPSISRGNMTGFWGAFQGFCGGNFEKSPRRSITAKALVDKGGFLLGFPPNNPLIRSFFFPGDAPARGQA